MNTHYTSPTQKEATKRNVLLIGLIVFLLIFLEPILYRTGLGYYYPMLGDLIFWGVIIFFALRKIGEKTTGKGALKKNLASNHFQTSTPSLRMQHSQDWLRAVLLIIILIAGATTLIGYFIANNSGF